VNRLVPHKVKKTPKTIFKYEGFTVQSLLNLKKNSVYFGSPQNFNDPYDCAIKASIAEPTPEEIERVKKYFMSKPDIPAHVKTDLKITSPQELKRLMLKAATKALRDDRENFLSNSGVTCFSEVKDDLLMWSHYGGQYKGFCLEFHTEYEPFNKLRYVKYVLDMPTLRIDTVIDNKEQIFDLYHTKSKAWEYEQEWRGFHEKAGTLFFYKPEALKAVYFGPDIERQALEIVCLILAGQNPDVELWEGKRSETEFKTQFSFFTYTSHIKAKQKGLL